MPAYHEVVIGSELEVFILGYYTIRGNWYKEEIVQPHRKNGRLDAEALLYQSRNIVDYLRFSRITNAPRLSASYRAIQIVIVP